jgi:hypothetical protein
MNSFDLYSLLHKHIKPIPDLPILCSLHMGIPDRLLMRPGLLLEHPVQSFRTLNQHLISGPLTSRSKKRRIQKSYRLLDYISTTIRPVYAWIIISLKNLVLLLETGTKHKEY